MCHLCCLCRWWQLFCLTQKSRNWMKRSGRPTETLLKRKDNSNSLLSMCINLLSESHIISTSTMISLTMLKGLKKYASGTKMMNIKGLSLRTLTRQKESSKARKKKRKKHISNLFWSISKSFCPIALKILKIFPCSTLSWICWKQLLNWVYGVALMSSENLFL